MSEEYEQIPCISMEELYKDWIGCQRCPLNKTRNKLVFGYGNPNADIFILGEGPGEQEDIEGKPFVGQSGEVIDQFISLSGLSRDADIFMTNIVCCRPTAEETDSRGRKFTANRAPTKEERLACLPRVIEQIYLVDPMVIITLGKPATASLLGVASKMGAVRGKMQTASIPGRYTAISYPVMPMYHPAYLIRNPDMTKNGPWDLTAKDMATVVSVVSYLREKYYGGVKCQNEET